MQNSKESLHMKNVIINRMKFAKTEQNSEISSETPKKSLKFLANFELFPLLQGILTFKACIWAIFRATAVN